MLLGKCHCGKRTKIKHNLFKKDYQEQDMHYTSIMISGLPGSGKSTLAQRLLEHYEWPVHSIGQLFRNKWKTLHPQRKY